MFDKRYGKHKYIKSRGIHCLNGCRCWIGKYRGSGGPPGIDPSLNGTCPRNPVDGVSLDKYGRDDFAYVVNQRVWRLGKIIKKQSELVTRLTKDNIDLKEKIERLKTGNVENSHDNVINGQI